MRRVDWVVLDLGETLVDETRVWLHWAERLGVPAFTFIGVLGGLVGQGRDHREVFPLLGHDGPPAREWALDERDLYDDAVPCLEALRSQGFRVAVMANQPRSSEALLSRLPLDAVGTSDSWGVAKPDPAFFKRVSEEVGATPERIAYVGDRVDNDVLPAKAAGMLAVFLRRGPWGVLHASSPRAAEADLRLDSLLELAPALTAADS